ncbi:MAG: DUF721 domain-containing protein [Spirochaetota bacterium]
MRKADDLIQRFLDSIGQTEEGSLYVGLFRSWQPIVGERIAAHAQPVDVRGHSLVVEADHPGWVQMVMMQRGRIIGELSRRFPQLEITGLTVRVADRPGQSRSGGAGQGREPGGDAAARGSQPPAGGQPPPPAPDEPPPTPPSRDEAEALDRIDDDDLRDTLARLRRDLDEKDE